MKVLTFIGKVLIGTALLILILGGMVFALGGFLITRPILRNNPAMRKMHAMSYAMVSLFALVSAFTPPETDPIPNVTKFDETWAMQPTESGVADAYARKECVYCATPQTPDDYDHDVCAHCGLSPLANRPHKFPPNS